MEYNWEEIGKRIRSERIKKKMTQPALWEALGNEAKGNKANGKQICVYEKGKTKNGIPMDVMTKLCSIFECELGFLLGESDYSEGTKIETEINNTTGLNKKTMDAIRKITGTERKCLSYGLEADSYRRIFNLLFSSREIYNLFERLLFLDETVALHKEPFTRLSKIIGPERLDYISDLYEKCDIRELENEQDIEDYKKFEEAIDLQIENKTFYQVKVARYELNEAFESLIDSIYPRLMETTLL